MTQSMQHPHRRAKVLGFPIEGFGLFTSLLLSFAAAFFTFFATTCIAIFGFLVWNAASATKSTSPIPTSISGFLPEFSFFLLRCRLLELSAESKTAQVTIHPKPCAKEMRPAPEGKAAFSLLATIYQTQPAWGFRVELGHLNLLRQANLRQQPDAPEVGIDLVPGQAVARGHRMRVVVVVPAFAAGQQRHPPVVARVVAGFKAAAAPQVRRRVHQPGSVQTQCHAQQTRPTAPWPTPFTHPPHSHPPAEQQQAAHGDGKPVIFAEPHVEIGRGSGRANSGPAPGLRMQRFAKENPAGVRPPSAFARRVRIAFLVAELVMHAMRRDPEDRPALKRQWWRRST